VKTVPMSPGLPYIANIVKLPIEQRFVVFTLLSIVEIFVRFVERDASNFGPW